jgi:hypothetical protein
MPAALNRPLSHENFPESAVNFEISHVYFRTGDLFLNAHPRYPLEIWAALQNGFRGKGYCAATADSRLSIVIEKLGLLIAVEKVQAVHRSLRYRHLAAHRVTRRPPSFPT